MLIDNPYNSIEMDKVKAKELLNYCLPGGNNPSEITNLLDIYIFCVMYRGLRS